MLPVEFGILGPLHVVVGERPVVLGAAKLRATLAVLLVHANQFTSLDRLVDELWEDRPPSTAAKLIPQYVSQLRRSLQPDWDRRPRAGPLLDTRPRGYLLHVEGDALDADRFRAMVERSRRLVRSDAAQAADGLRQALDLWRGVPLADVPRTPSVAAAAVQLEELRMAAVEDRIEAELALGRHTELVCELSALVSRHPLQERPRGQLMLALYRSGRQAEALQAYQATRQVLLEELGIEPGRELRQLQQAILIGDPALEPASDKVRVAAAAPSAQVPPAQLPADVADFTGRGRHLWQLRQLLAASQRTTAVSISAIVGGAGTGKTALAVHWAHQVRHRFGDGQLYVELRGTALTAPLRPIQALTNLLRGLGVTADDVPDDMDQAAALYRTLLADRRVLVVLDDARDAEQLRPLLPGSPGCLVLVTSRDQLAGLVAQQGARRLPLDVLTPAEAMALLVRVLGDQQVRTEPAATAELVRACGRLPLALRTAAADLTGQPRRSIASYVDQLGQATPSLPA